MKTAVEPLLKRRRQRGATLYRHFDDAGRLLYVGISLAAVARLVDHTSVSRWADKIATVTLVHYQTRAEAHAAERAAIIAERPVYNLVRYGAPLQDIRSAVKAGPTGSLVDPDEPEPIKLNITYHSDRRRQLIAEGKLTELDREKWESGGYGPHPFGPSAPHHSGGPEHG